MASARAAPGSVGGQIVRVRLHRRAVLQEQQPFPPGGHGADEAVGFSQQLPQPLRHRTDVNRLGQIQIGVVIRPVTRVAADFRDQASGRIAGAFATAAQITAPSGKWRSWM